MHCLNARIHTQELRKTKEAKKGTKAEEPGGVRVGSKGAARPQG
jgi:hypothetical protein